MTRRCPRRRCQGSSSPSWADLQPELVQAIARSLNPNYDDIQRFRSVCKNWRLATPPPLQLYPVLPHNFKPYQKSFSSTAVYLLRQRRHHCHDSSSSAARNTWLITVEQSHCGKLRLLHPLTGHPIENLPQDFLSNSLFNVETTKEISRSFYLNNNDDDDNSGDHSLFLYSANNRKNTYKVILWPNTKLKSPGPEDHAYVVLRGGRDPGNILLCYDTTQGFIRQITYVLLTLFDDIVWWKGLIWTVDRFGRLYGIEYETMNVVTIFVTTPLPYNDQQRSQLMKSNGKIYLVKPGAIKVYELNEERHLWEELTNLGDRILFVRHDNCFFVKASDLPSCQENSVVVIPDFKESKSKIPRHASRLFEGAGGYVNVRVYKYGEDGKKFKLISLCPGFSDVLWPPPPWITKHDGN